MHSILIVDDNINWSNTLSVMLNKEDDFDVLAQAETGGEAIALIERLLPDIIILDIVMPEYDGVQIVSYIRTQIPEYNPIIYIISGIGTDTMINSLNRMYVDYFSLKPVLIGSVISNLRTIIAKRSDGGISGSTTFTKSPDAKDRVHSLMLELGLQMHKASTRCAAEALIFYLENPGYDRVLTKVVYPLISEKYNLTISAVEKNIRNAILQMQKQNNDLYNSLFAYAAGQRITNGEFLSVASAHLTKDQ